MILIKFHKILKQMKILMVKQGCLDRVLRLNTYRAHLPGQIRLIALHVTEPFHIYFSSTISLNAFILFVI